MKGEKGKWVGESEKKSIDRWSKREKKPRGWQFVANKRCYLVQLSLGLSVTFTPLMQGFEANKTA